MLSRPAGADFGRRPRERLAGPVEPCEYPRRIRPLFQRRVRIERDVTSGKSALEHGCRIALRRRGEDQANEDRHEGGHGLFHPLEIDNRAGIEVGDPELRRRAGMTHVTDLRVGIAAVCGELRGLITPLHSYPDALRARVLLAPATERQQIEPRAALVASEPGNDRTGAIQADAPFVIADFRADAS